MVEPLKVITQTESWAQARDESIVQLLKDALEMAERGEFSGVAILANLRDERIYTGYSNMDNRTEFLGLMDRVKHGILMNMYYEAESE